MRLFDEGKKIFKKKYLEIPAGKCEVFCADDLPEAKRKKAIKAFAPGITVGSVIGLIDNSIPHNASAGALFADFKFYFSDFPHKPKKIWYDEIQNVSVKKKRSKNQDAEKSIIIELKDCISSNMSGLWHGRNCVG